MTGADKRADRGFRAATRDPVAGRLLLAAAVSEAGDFVGQAALILLTYHATGTVMGPAAVLAAGTLPTLLVGTVFGPLLDRPRRRTALVSLTLIGAAACSAVAAAPVFVAAVIAAFVLGAARIAYVGISVGAVTDAVAEDNRPAFFALLTTINDGAQIVGFLTGSAATLAFGARWALGADAVSFLIGAAVLSRLPGLPAHQPEEEPGPLSGFRAIRRTRPLLLIAPVVFVTMCGASLPETLAPRLARGVALPFVMVAYPLGSILAGVVVARSRLLGSIRIQLRLALICGVAFATGALAVWAGVGPWPIAGANFVIGAGSIWIVGARTTFAREAPPHLMAQIEASMVAALTIGNGLGTLALSGLATTVGPGWAYGTESLVGVAVAAAALAAHRRQPVPAPAPAGAAAR